MFYQGLAVGLCVAHVGSRVPKSLGALQAHCGGSWVQSGQNNTPDIPTGHWAPIIGMYFNHSFLSIITEFMHSWMDE